MNGMFIELPFDVEYDFSMGRAAVMYPNDRASPEEPAELVVTSVKKNGLELIEVLSDEELEAIERTIWDDIEASYDDPRY